MGQRTSGRACPRIPCAARLTHLRFQAFLRGPNVAPRFFFASLAVVHNRLI
jgi:hypothetical protein